MNRADPLYTVLILYTPIIPGVNLHFSADPSVSTPIRDSNIASLTLYQPIIYLEVSFRIPIFVGTSLSLNFQIYSIPSSVPVRSIPFSHFSLEFHQKVYFIFYGRFFIRGLRGPLVITFISGTTTPTSFPILSGISLRDDTDSICYHSESL